MATKKKATKRKAPAKKVTARRTATKKTAVRKVAAKRVAAKRAAVSAPKRKTTAIQAKMTKSQIVTEIADNLELTRKQVSGVFDELSHLIERSIRKRSVGEFAVPGLMKIMTVKKPAKKARKGINPFTGQEQMFKAKPASIAVKVRALKKLKTFATS